MGDWINASLIGSSFSHRKKSSFYFYVENKTWMKNINGISTLIFFIFFLGGGSWTLLHSTAPRVTSLTILTMSPTGPGATTGRTSTTSTTRPCAPPCSARALPGSRTTPGLEPMTGIHCSRTNDRSVRRMTVVPGITMWVKNTYLSLRHACLILFRVH